MPSSSPFKPSDDGVYSDRVSWQKEFDTDFGNYLVKWKTTLLTVSHDRDFLNAEVTDVIHLHSQTLTVFHFANHSSLSASAAQNVSTS